MNVGPGNLGLQMHSPLACYALDVLNQGGGSIEALDTQRCSPQLKSRRLDLACRVIQFGMSFGTNKWQKGALVPPSTTFLHEHKWWNGQRNRDDISPEDMLNLSKLAVLLFRVVGFFSRQATALKVAEREAAAGRLGSGASLTWERVSKDPRMVIEYYSVFLWAKLPDKIVDLYQKDVEYWEGQV